MSFTRRKHSEETKEKIRKSQLGKNNSFYGKTHSDEIKLRISNANKGMKHDDQWKEKQSIVMKGENNPMWKGNNVGYNSLHQWVNIHYHKSEYCEMCGLSKAYDLANITGEYNRDFKNWMRLCRKCHMISDGRLERFIQNRSK